MSKKTFLVRSILYVLAHLFSLFTLYGLASAQEKIGMAFGLSQSSPNCETCASLTKEQRSIDGSVRTWQLTMAGDPSLESKILQHFGNTLAESNFYSLLTSEGLTPLMHEALVANSEEGSALIVPLGIDFNEGVINIGLHLSTRNSSDSKEQTLIYSLFYNPANYSLLKEEISDPSKGTTIEMNFVTGEISRSSRLGTSLDVPYRSLSEGDFIDCLLNRIIVISVNSLCGNLSAQLLKAAIVAAILT